MEGWILYNWGYVMLKIYCYDINILLICKPGNKHKAKTYTQFSSVAQSFSTLCDPMNRSTPGLPVHHQLPELTQIHVHWVSDAIQPSHPLLSPSPHVPNASQHQVLSNESALRMRWPMYWSFSFSIILSKEIPGLISFKWTG